MYIMCMVNYIYIYSHSHRGPISQLIRIFSSPLRQVGHLTAASMGAEEKAESGGPGYRFKWIWF